MNLQPIPIYSKVLQESSNCNTTEHYLVSDREYAFSARHYLLVILAKYLLY